MNTISTFISAVVILLTNVNAETEVIETKCDWIAYGKCAFYLARNKDAVSFKLCVTTTGCQKNGKDT